jgi:hypothetical protein
MRLLCLVLSSTARDLLEVVQNRPTFGLLWHSPCSGEYAWCFFLDLPGKWRQWRPISLKRLRRRAVLEKETHP